MSGDDGDRGGFSRRTFLGATGAGAALIPAITARAAPAAVGPTVLGPGPVPLSFTLNGQAKTVKVEPRETLAEVLLYRLDLTGTKVACDRGACGACTVIVGGSTKNACMTPALDCEGKSVTSVEGIGNKELHPVQQALLEADGLQCGYCTPGFVVSACALRQKNPSPTEEQLREALSGNLCRCGSQPHILQALLAMSGDQARRKE